MFYMDTNVLLSKYKLDDPYHKSSSKIVSGLGQGTLQCCSSSLTLLELACVTSRMIEQRPKLSADVVRGRYIAALTRRLLGLNIKFVDPPGDSQLQVGAGAQMPAIFHKAYSVSYEIGLKTLDSIHLAAAMFAARLESRIDFFVTGDQDFLRRRKRLREIAGFSFVDPDEFAKLMGL